MSFIARRAASTVAATAQNAASAVKRAAPGGDRVLKKSAQRDPELYVREHTIYQQRVVD